MKAVLGHGSWRLPFYYGWLIIGIAFVTMAIAVSAALVPDNHHQ